jgi:peroxiredoxin family protein
MNKLSIILFSGTVDKLMPVGVLSSAAAAIGMEVEVFATFWGLLALKKGSQVAKISKDAEDMGPMMMQLFKEKKVPSWLDMLRQAKEIGNVKVYACAMTFDLMGMKQEDLEDVVDEVVGAGEYLEKAKEADITLFI